MKTEKHNKHVNDVHQAAPDVILSDDGMLSVRGDFAQWIIRKAQTEGKESSLLLEELLSGLAAGA